MMKRLLINSVIVATMVFLLTGCTTGNVASADGKKICSRTGTVTNGTSKMSYEVYYEDDYVTILHSTEEVTSDDSSVLDTYEEAYKNIFKQYEGLKYYDNIVTRTDNSIISDTTSAAFTFYRSDIYAFFSLVCLNIILITPVFASANIRTDAMSAPPTVLTPNGIT